MRKVGNAESGHEAVSGCGRETLLVEVLLNYLLLPFYIYIYYYSIIPSLEYLNVHFPTFLLFYFLLIERKTFLLNICVKTILFHIIIKNSLYLCKP
jgi:hypothetical protein